MDSNVRVRFAPSPTGYLHIGGARTALFNWLLARQQGGTFVLRIEDTDQTRHVEDSLAKILEDLRWLGLQWDEGPQVGGAYGPYFQSQRLQIYRQYGDDLLGRSKAYYAFETPEELARMRAQARAEKRAFKYPRPAQFPTEKQSEEARSAGKPAVVRFKAPADGVTVTDAILGEVRIEASELEDFVILKADGFPTYHFACVVDDALMKISHVVRGQEHLINTAKHVALQRALSFNTPVYAHLPLIFNASGSKMSKRDKEKAVARGDPPPEIDVHDFRLAGFLPEALLNHVALLGWSPADGREKLTVDDLVKGFSLERIGKTNARFDHEKLRSFNTDWAADSLPERLLVGLKDYLQLHDVAMRSADDAVLAKVLEVCKGFRTFADVVAKAGFLFAPDEQVQFDPKAVKKVLAAKDGEGYELLRKLLHVLTAQDPWSEASLESLLKSKAEEWGVGFGRIAQPIRVAVSGTTVSPGIVETLVLLGKERTCRRVERCLAASAAGD